MIDRAVSLGALLLSLALVEGGGAAETPHIDTFVTPAGEGYFALRLVPDIAQPPRRPQDIVVVFDTSASQAGEYRDKALATLDSLLSAMGPQDRVQLWAVDVGAVSLTQAFVHPGAAEVRGALTALRRRVPLGSTDMPAALDAIQAAYGDASASGRDASASGRDASASGRDASASGRDASASGRDASASGRDRAAIYLGDGISATNLITSARLKTWAKNFSAAKIPLTSFAVGPRVDLQFLGSLAMMTGGTLVVEDDEVNGREAGLQLLDAARGAVIWPDRLQLPTGFQPAYFRGAPPLRFDRDTVVIGEFTPQAKQAQPKETASKQASSKQASSKQSPSKHVEAQSPSTAEIRVDGSLYGRPVALSWRVSVGPPNDDQAYLAELVALAQRDGGVSLPTLGGTALDGMRQLVQLQTRNLVKLGEHAVATGDAASARQLAAAATRLDPTNVEALTIRRAAARVDSSRATPATAAAYKQVRAQPNGGEAGGDERGSGASDRVETGDLPEREAADGDLLSDVERQQRVFEGFLRTEVRNALSDARRLLGVDPQTAADTLKLMLDKVRRTTEVRPEIRAQLVDQIESGLRAASRQSVLKNELDLRQLQIAAEGEARERINRELFLQQQKVDQLMARFNALMDEERYRDAEAVASIAEEIEPGRAGLRGAELTSRMVGYTADMSAVRDMRHKGFVDAAFQIELSHVPTADEPPILYPDPEVWQLLTERRKKYKAVDVKQNSPNEQQIMNALDEKTDIDFADQPLMDVVEYLETRHGIGIQLDERALTDAGVSTDTPITRSIKGITLRSALKLILAELDLTYVIRNEVLMITSKTEAENLLVTKVYPVADLVVPVQSVQIGRGGRF